MGQNTYTMNKEINHFNNECICDPIKNTTEHELICHFYCNNTENASTVCKCHGAEEEAHGENEMFKNICSDNSLNNTAIQEFRGKMLKNSILGECASKRNTKGPIKCRLKFNPKNNMLDVKCRPETFEEGILLQSDGSGDETKTIEQFDYESETEDPLYFDYKNSSLTDDEEKVLFILKVQNSKSPDEFQKDTLYPGHANGGLDTSNKYLNQRTVSIEPPWENLSLTERITTPFVWCSFLLLIMFSFYGILKLRKKFSLYRKKFEDSNQKKEEDKKDEYELDEEAFDIA